MTNTNLLFKLTNVKDLILFTFIYQVHVTFESCQKTLITFWRLFPELGWLVVEPNPLFQNENLSINHGHMERNQFVIFNP